MWQCVEVVQARSAFLRLSPPISPLPSLVLPLHPFPASLLYCHDVPSTLGPQNASLITDEGELSQCDVDELIQDVMTEAASYFGARQLHLYRSGSSLTKLTPTHTHHLEHTQTPSHPQYQAPCLCASLPLLQCPGNGACMWANHGQPLIRPVAHIHTHPYVAHTALHKTGS